MLRLRGMRNSQDGSLAKPDGNQVVGNEENKFRAPRPAHRDMNRTPLYPVKDNHRRSTRKRPLNTKDASVSKIANGRLVEVFEDSMEKPIERYAARKDTFEPPTKVTRAKANQHDVHQHDNTIAISNNLSVGLETTCSKSALYSPSRHQSSSNGTIGSLFQTGRGQNVKVSEAKVQAYEKLLHNDFTETSISENIEEKTSIQSLFSNGRGNAIHIPAKTLKHYEDIVHNYDDCNEDEQSSLVISHFQTGSGKNVKVSAGNLQKYKKIIAFENYESDENEEPLSSVTTLFQTGSGKSVQISASKLKKYELQYAADNEVLQIDSNDAKLQSASITSLFQTGSGKSVQISALNLQKYTEQIASDDSTSDILSGNFRPINNGEEHQLPAVDEEHISHFVKNGVDGTEDDGESYPRHPKATKTTSELNVNSMFQTGLGRTVKVSAKKAQLYDQILFSSNDRQSEEVDTSVKNIPQAVCDQRIQDNFIDEAKQLFFDKPGALNVGHDTNRSNFNSVANGQEGLNSHIHEKDFSEMSKVQSLRPIEASKRLVESASHETPSIYSDKAKEYQAKLLKSHTSDRFPSNDFLGQNSAMTESLFQTGSGRSVQVSAHLVHVYQEKFARDKPTGEFCENLAAENSLEHIPKPIAKAGFVQSEGTVEDNAQMQTSAIETSSFQSCRGQDIRTSTAAFKRYEVKFQTKKQTNLLDENAARSHDTESTRLNFGEQGQNTVSEVRDNTSKFGHMAKISFVKVEKDAADGYDLGSSSSGVVQSLFQTAGGSDVMVSTEKLRMYDMKLQSDNFDEANAQITSQAHGILVTNSSEGDYTILFERTSSDELVKMAVPVNEYHQIEQVDQTLQVNEHKTTYPTSNELDNINTSNVELPTAKQTFSARIRDKRTFQPPRPRKQSTSPVVPGKAISKPIISVSNKFPIHVYEKWSFSALASCPDAFNKYPFESPIMDITAENAHLVRFDYLGKPNLDSHDGNVGALDLYNYMVSLNFLNPAIGATFRWFINHFRWVVLKCASMERAFVSQLFGKYCAQAQIAYQLNRRCQLELENSQRPILKRVYQKDVHAGNAMVLFVAAVYETHWVLSDGWRHKTRGLELHNAK
ncbi:hypothetical protein AeRB84_005885 [Aphanomyces euteiches]|nr:hypothetical protein AeRB84_017978 [Aphanomyces euteiches]KAH9151519.1 hypothetical protein AeRB84_005885 [Aphanomyces euteiches]